MQILPTLDSSNAPDGYLPVLERSVSPSQPFSDVMNRLIETAREQKNNQSGSSASNLQSGKNSTKAEVNSDSKNSASETKLPSELTVDREALTEIKNKLKEYGMSDESIKDIADEISSDGEISWKRLQKIISDKLELSDDSYDPELSQQEQTELLSLFQKLNFTVDQSNRLLEAVSGSDQAEDAWALIKKHVNALSDESLSKVNTSEVTVLAKALGVSGGTQLSQALMEQANSSGDGSKAKNAINILFQQADAQDSYLSEKAAALKDILHTGLQAATKRGENSKLADNRNSKDVDNAKIRIEDGAEKRYGEKKTSMLEDTADTGKDSASSNRNTKDDTSVTQNKAYETQRETQNKETQAKTAGLREQVGKSSAEAQEKLDLQAQQRVSDEQIKQGLEKGEDAASAKQGVLGAENAAKTGKNGAAQDGAEKNADKSESIQKAAVMPDGSVKNADLANSGEGSQDDSPKDLLSGKKEQLVIGKKSSEETAAASGKESKTETQKAWEEMLGKVEVTDGSTLKADGTSGTQGTGTASKSVLEAREEVSAARVMKTVESGVLNNVGQGRTQLTIRLDPPSLGQLTVSLQVKNDEVQAIIRTDNHEVGKIISDNINLVRHSLEQQGLKVEKLDVQTQLQDGSDKSWQSADQHNQAQQQSQRDQLRTSLRTLQNLAMQGESLTQDSQEAVPLTLSNHDGLDLIA